MTGLSYVSIIADTQGFNNGGSSLIPAEHGGLGAFWSAGVLEWGGFGGEEEEEEGKEAGIGYEAP